MLTWIHFYEKVCFTKVHKLRRMILFYIFVPIFIVWLNCLAVFTYLLLLSVCYEVINNVASRTLLQIRERMRVKKVNNMLVLLWNESWPHGSWQRSHGSLDHTLRSAKKRAPAWGISISGTNHQPDFSLWAERSDL